MKNKYIVRSRISEKKFREILRYFALDLEAKKIAEICKISRPCVNRIVQQAFNRKRMRKISKTKFLQKMSGEIEVDESYFGGVRVKRGRGAGKKTSVFLLRATHSSLYEKEC